MNEDFSSNQQEVVDLLEKLGKSEVNYPQELMTNARAVFQYKISAARDAMVDTSAALSETQAASAAAAESGTTLISWPTALKIALATAVVSAVVYGAYLLAEMFEPNLVQDAPTAVYSAPTDDLETATEQPNVINFIETLIAPSTQVDSVPGIQSTPEPASEREHPGKHLGQTPGPPNAPGLHKTPKRP